jgi:hypothetical protein
MTRRRQPPAMYMINDFHGPMLGDVRAGDCPGAAGHAADLFGYAIKTLSITSRQNLDFYAGVYN